MANQRYCDRGLAGPRALPPSEALCTFLSSLNHALCPLPGLPHPAMCALSLSFPGQARASEVGLWAL